MGKYYADIHPRSCLLILWSIRLLGQVLWISWQGHPASGCSRVSSWKSVSIVNQFRKLKAPIFHFQWGVWDDSRSELETIDYPGRNQLVLLLHIISRTMWWAWRLFWGPPRITTWKTVIHSTQQTNMARMLDYFWLLFIIQKRPRFGQREKKIHLYRILSTHACKKAWLL